MLLWKLPPARLNAMPSAFIIVSLSIPTILPAMAVAANKVHTPVGSKPLYVEQAFILDATSAPATRLVRNSFPVQPSANSAIAKHTGTHDDPRCIPGTMPSQKSRARAI